MASRRGLRSWPFTKAFLGRPGWTSIGIQAHMILTLCASVAPELCGKPTGPCATYPGKEFVDFFAGAPYFLWRRLRPAFFEVNWIDDYDLELLPLACLLNSAAFVLFFRAIASASKALVRKAGKAQHFKQAPYSESRPSVEMSRHACPSIAWILVPLSLAFHLYVMCIVLVDFPYVVVSYGPGWLPMHYLLLLPGVAIAAVALARDSTRERGIAFIGGWIDWTQCCFWTSALILLACLVSAALRHL